MTILLIIDNQKIRSWPQRTSDWKLRFRDKITQIWGKIRIFGGYFPSECWFLGQKRGFWGMRLDTWSIKTLAKNLRKRLIGKSISAKGADFKNDRFFTFF